ncbi:unnamed protein product [Cyprideis torosa]|uniref:Uncharacterized protein n=1 Tax=Cyprideis torosa TaxID=163714 RepID=A0A7R8W9Y3_9CRUS|nr:unnamed protein product [Cyprideis torosa]CAG0884896.1 unnamed protein product [Cyprideis torosa]
MKMNHLCVASLLLSLAVLAVGASPVRSWSASEQIEDLPDETSLDQYEGWLLSRLINPNFLRSSILASAPNVPKGFQKPQKRYLGIEIPDFIAHKGGLSNVDSLKSRLRDVGRRK